MKINIKPNLRQFLTDKIKTQKKDFQKTSGSNQNSNLIKQINSHTNSNKNIGKFSLLNSIKDKDSKKISKLIEEANNNNYNFNNNSFLKEAQNEFNKFRKSKTTEKVKGNNNLVNHQDNKGNKNKKIMIKQNTGNAKKYNLSVSKIPKYDSSAFKQVIQYYTIKSESKTIQIEELSTYLRPIRNILGFANKMKTQSNISSSININNHHDHKIKNYLNNSNNNNAHNNNNNNNNNREIIAELNQNKNSIDNENCKTNEVQNDENNNKIDNNNNDNEDVEDKKDKNPEEHSNIQSNNLTNNISLNNIKMNASLNNNISNEIKNDINNNTNKINTSLIKNCVFNNISHTQRKNKFTPIPFKIVIDKINNTKIENIKSMAMNEINNKDLNSNNINNDNNNNVNINNNIINSKNASEIETQISTNNNANNNIAQTQAFNQYRPRKMNLPKTGINLTSMQFKKNKILQNILNKRKQKK